MKYWWASYITLYGNKVAVVGPWNDNIAPLKELKNFALSSTGEFIVFPVTGRLSLERARAAASEVWSNPELKGLYLVSTLKSNLSKSINEEAIAASVYRQRKATADPTTAKLYEHIASEEDGHRAEFSKRISELESDKAKIKYNALGGYIV